MALARARQVIVNADDFGLSAVNNAGIISAYRNGVVTSTSLMVGGDAASEAVQFARSNPGLAVGLHVTFSDTRPVLPAQRVALLVQPNGYFPSNERAHRVALLSGEGRRQVREEIAAQFQAFHATGLVCDHVDVHRHANQNNPPLSWMIFREAFRSSASTVRVPWDPPKDPLRRLRASLLRRMARHHNLSAADRSVGREWTVQGLVDYVRDIPEGVTELFFHPVNTRAHRYAGDLPLLLDGRVKSALSGVAARGFRDVVTS